MEDVKVVDVNFAPQVPQYRVFEGPRRIAVEQAIAKDPDSRHKASIEELMQFRLDALNSKYEPAISQAWNNWYDSNTWIGYCAGKVKIGEGFSMPENPQLKQGALVRTEKEFEELKGKAILRKKYNGSDWQSKDKVLKDPAWRAVGRKTLKPYMNAEFKKYNFQTAMGVYFADELDVSTQRALVLGGGNGRSSLNGIRDFGSGGFRLVGVLNLLSLRSATSAELKSGLEEAVAKK